MYARSTRYTTIFENAHFLEFFIHFRPDVHLLCVENILFISLIVAELTALNL